MRKPLLLIGIVCCLLFSAATPLTLAKDRNDPWLQDSPSFLSLDSWLIVTFFKLPVLLPPMGTNIFNDGPDPVGSGDSKEEDEPEDEPEPEGDDGGPKPIDSIVTGDLSGDRD